MYFFFAITQKINLYVFLFFRYLSFYILFEITQKKKSIIHFLLHSIIYLCISALKPLSTRYISHLLIINFLCFLAFISSSKPLWERHIIRLYYYIYLFIFVFPLWNHSRERYIRHFLLHFIINRFLYFFAFSSSSKSLRERYIIRFFYISLSITFLYLFASISSPKPLWQSFIIHFLHFLIGLFLYFLAFHPPQNHSREIYITRFFYYI